MFTKSLERNLDMHGSGHVQFPNYQGKCFLMEERSTSQPLESVDSADVEVI